MVKLKALGVSMALTLKTGDKFSQEGEASDSHISNISRKRNKKMLRKKEKARS